MIYWLSCLLWGLSLLGVSECKRLPALMPIYHPETGEEIQRGVILEKKLPLDLDSMVLDGMLERGSRQNSVVQDGADEGKKRYKRDQEPAGRGDIVLESTLQVIPSISIFSGYMRELDDVMQQLGSSLENMIVFAPTDESISQLPLKPWEYPNDIESLEKDGESHALIENAIKQNVARFVLSHVVSNATATDIGNADEVLLRSDYFPPGTPGGDIFLKKEGADYYVASAPNRSYIKVQRVETAANGVVMVIGSCLSEN